jgi:hypothetical protein
LSVGKRQKERQGFVQRGDGGRSWVGGDGRSCQRESVSNSTATEVQWRDALAVTVLVVVEKTVAVAVATAE